MVVAPQDKNSKEYNYFANRIRKVAAQFVGSFVFNIANKNTFAADLKDYGTHRSPTSVLYLPLCRIWI